VDLVHSDEVGVVHPDSRRHSPSIFFNVFTSVTDVRGEVE
jgi:hypothetical protein